MCLLLQNRVEKSNAAEAQETGSGKIWLYAILACCAVLFGGALAVLIFLMIEFTGCSTNNTFIGLTLVFCLLLTVAQMTSDEGSLLSSACISAWAVFLCYNAVSKNPNTDCNPRLGELSPLRIALGLLMTLLSLAWTGWSYTAADKFTNNKSTDANKPSAQNAPDGEIDQPLPDSNSEGPKKRAVTGVVVTETATHDTDGTANGDTSGDGANNDESTDSAANKPTYNNAWKLNMVLAAVTCWSAMTLTEWGQIQSNGTIANPTVGHVGMWVIVGSQWFVMTLYLWTLVAPRLFPDRDFS